MKLPQPPPTHCDSCGNSSLFERRAKNKRVDRYCLVCAKAEAGAGNFHCVWCGGLLKSRLNSKGTGYWLHCIHHPKGEDGKNFRDRTGKRAAFFTTTAGVFVHVKRNGSQLGIAGGSCAGSGVALVGGSCAGSGVPLRRSPCTQLKVLRSARHNVPAESFSPALARLGLGEFDWFTGKRKDGLR